MCYDISYQITLESVEDYFGALIYDDPQIELTFVPMDHMQGVAVFPKHPIIYQHRDDGKLHCRMMEWGIIRFFEKEEPQMLNRNKMLNIRSERIFGDPKSYWNKIRNRRCIIPLSHAIEHRGIVGWKKKVPYAMRPKGAHVFGVPGLYSKAEIPNKETGEIIERWTFGIITRKANSVIRNIHNDGDNPYRMVLFLPHKMLMEFVSNDLTEERYKEILNYEMQPEDMDYWPVWTVRTSKPRPDGKGKMEYFEWEKLPPLGEGNPPIDEKYLEPA